MAENNNDYIHRIKRAVSTRSPVARREHLVESDSDTRVRRAVENRQPFIEPYPVLLMRRLIHRGYEQLSFLNFLKSQHEMAGAFEPLYFSEVIMFIEIIITRILFLL